MHLLQDSVLLCKWNTQLSPVFFCLISVKILNYLILYADARQGWNSKPSRVGFSSKKAGTTYASTSKNLSLNYLNPYRVIAFVKVRIRNPYLVFFPLADLANKNTNPLEDSFSFRKLLLGMFYHYLMEH